MEPAIHLVEIAIPGPSGLPLIGHLPQMAMKPLAFLKGAWREYGDIFAIDVEGPTVVIVHPDDIHTVLTDGDCYGRDPRTARILAPVLGPESLLLAEGAVWERLRRTAGAAFHARYLPTIVQHMYDEANNLCARWSSHAKQGTPLNAGKEMGQLALNILLRSVLGIKNGEHSDRIAKLVNIVLAETDKRTSRPAFWNSLPTLSNWRFRGALAELKQVVNHIIDERSGGAPQDDMLSLLLQWQIAEKGKKHVNRDELFSQTQTMLSAGQVTTALAMAWALYRLGRNTAMATRLAEEGRSLSSCPTLLQLKEMKTSWWVGQETLRLYPSAWLFTRQTKKDVILRGYYIPAGTVIFVAPFLTHQHPKFWSHPDRFDPDRFQVEPHKTAWIPFGYGPMKCLGWQFAMLEMQIALTTIMARFKVDLANPSVDIRAKPILTLNPDQPILITIQDRK